MIITIFFQDPGFVIDTAETIYRTIQETNLTVKTKASWALGNLSDALVLNPSEIPPSLLLKLFQVAIAACDGNDKIKSNVVRALGNFLQIVDAILLNDSRFIETTARATLALISNAASGGYMKVRWNACHSLASVLRNQHLYANKEIAFRRIFTVLTELVVGFKNFKVRINAAVALSAPRTRIFYGEFYVASWIAFLKALETSQNMEDFSEYKHRDHLVEQVGTISMVCFVFPLASIHFCYTSIVVYFYVSFVCVFCYIFVEMR